jgi:hypothetical protein
LRLSAENKRRSHVLKDWDQDLEQIPLARNDEVQGPSSTTKLKVASSRSHQNLIILPYYVKVLYPQPFTMHGNVTHFFSLTDSVTDFKYEFIQKDIFNIEILDFIRK